jgi:hypothetical protein
MRGFFVFILITIFSRSFGQGLTNFIPKEYTYPTNRMGAGKIFTYEDSLVGKQTFTEVRVSTKNGKRFRSTKGYSLDSKSDSTVYWEDGSAEHYIFFLGNGIDPIKGENIRDTIIRNGQKLGVHSTQITYQTDATICTATSREDFLKDTTMAWKGNLLPTLIVSGNSMLEIKAKEDPSLRHLIEVQLLFYYAKGIGLVQYNIHFTDHTGQENSGFWKLKSIEDVRN